MYIAPLRIDFAGGWTDVPPYSSRHGGAVVNCAIALHVAVECRPRDRGVRLTSEDLGIEVEADSIDGLRYDGRLDLIKAAVRHSGLDRGCEIITRSGVPAGSGLGASGALGVALVSATFAAAGHRPSLEEAAEIAHRLEVEEIGVAGGKQDQYAAALGGFLFLEFHDPDVRATRIECAPSFLDELGRRMVLCYTGSSHDSGATIARVMRRVRDGDARMTDALDSLREAALAARQAIAAGDIEALAATVDRNWSLQRALDPAMATPEMTRVESAARAAGAIAAKACGSGAGGCMAFITCEGAAADVRRAIQAAGHRVLPLRFEPEGVRPAPPSR